MHECSIFFLCLLFAGSPSWKWALSMLDNTTFDLWPLPPRSNISLSRGLIFGECFLSICLFNCCTSFLFYLSFLFDFYFKVSFWACGFIMSLSFGKNLFLLNGFEIEFQIFKETFWYKISSCFTYNIIYNEDKYITAPCNRGSVSAVNKWLCPLFFYIPQTKFVNNFFILIFAFGTFFVFLSQRFFSICYFTCH